MKNQYDVEEASIPVHYWTRATAGTFHAFHTAWIAEFQRTFNSGVLPKDYYALAEQVAGNIGPDVLTLQQSDDESWDSSAET